MRKAIRLSLIILVLFITSCKKEDPEPDNNSSTTQSVDYWGCWSEETGKNGVYDIILIENQSGPHTFQLGTSCVQEPAIPSQDIGVFRNDTLILDNGTIEFWCFIENNTLLYSAYTSSPTIERFIKI